MSNANFEYPANVVFLHFLHFLVGVEIETFNVNPKSNHIWVNVGSFIRTLNKVLHGNYGIIINVI